MISANAISWNLDDILWARFSLTLEGRANKWMKKTPFDGPPLIPCLYRLELIVIRTWDVKLHRVLASCWFCSFLFQAMYLISIHANVWIFLYFFCLQGLFSFLSENGQARSDTINSGDFLMFSIFFRSARSTVCSWCALLKILFINVCIFTFVEVRVHDSLTVCMFIHTYIRDAVCR